jgi:membrane fusion protein, multidrug efflux system
MNPIQKSHRLRHNRQSASSMRQVINAASALKSAGWVGVLCLALAGCSKDKVVQHEDIRPVRTVTASRTAGSVSATYSGEIRARYESKLGFKVAGKVNARLVEVGSHVKAGQALLRLDPQDAVLSEASAEAQTESARVKLSQSRIDLERGERLLADHIISKSAFDQYKLTYDTAVSQLRSTQAQQQLMLNQRAYNVLTADRAGVVTAIDAEIGHVVSAGQPVITVAADGEREVLVSVPESRVEELRNAKKMTATTWAHPQRPYAAALRELAPDTDKATRTYAARITVRDPDAAIRLGMTASVQIPNIEGGSAIRVPLSAIHDKTGQPLVWIVDTKTSTVHTRPVKLSAAHKNSVLVAEGVNEGDVVVTAGVHMLHDGQKVKVAQPEVVVGSLQ